MSEFADIAPGADAAALLFNSRWINHVTRAGNANADRASGPPIDRRDSFVPLDVINDSGAAIDAPFPILRLTSPVVTVADNANAPYNGADFKGDTPDADTGASFVILQGPAGSGKARPAVLVGLSWAKVDVIEAADAFATTIDGDDTKLKSGSDGVPILWKETGTGEKWALVLLGGGSGSSLVWGQATSNITAATSWAAADRGTGTVQLYDAAGAADGDPIDVESDFRDSFDINSVVCVDRKFTPARVVSVGCTVVPEE